MSIDRITLRDWHEGRHKDAAPGSVALPWGFSVSKSEVGGQRVRRFVASDQSVDRDGDTIDPSGWELDNYRKAGSFLWAHDPGLPPIGGVETIEVEGQQLMLAVKFTDADMQHPFGRGFGHSVMRMYDEGAIRGVSVGFVPIEWTYNEERGGWSPTDFKRQELLEVSATPVPSNPNAVHVARSAGIDVAPVMAWAEHARDNGGAWVKSAAGLWLDQHEPKKTTTIGANPMQYIDHIKAATKAAGSVVDEIAERVDALADAGALLGEGNAAKLAEVSTKIASILGAEPEPEAKPEPVDMSKYVTQEQHKSDLESLTAAIAKQVAR